jgi:NifU-like protein involved in Fe-S cluster formation
MSEEIQILIKHYASNPINNYVMTDYSIKNSEWNMICDDDIEIYLKISDDWIIEKYSFTWNLSIVWIAAASILAEEIEWKSLDEILSWWYDFMKNLGFSVSTRRKRAAVLPILAVRNAIHVYKNDWKKDEFDDLTESC